MAGGTSVKSLLKDYEKQYKAKVGVMGIRDDDPERLQTGMFTFDLQTGGGIPEGRVTLFYGLESAMKTTLSLKALAAAQRKYPDRTPAFIDVEGHLDRTWAKKMGVDVDRLAHIIPENAEQAVDITESLLAADDVSLIVFDSLAALLTTTELEKAAEENSPGRTGLIINRLYRKVTHALNTSRTVGAFMPTLVVINQVRYKIGVGPGQDPETMPGGPAFKFISSLTVRLGGSDIMDSKIHKALPAYKRISSIIRKHKVPICAKKAELLVALQPIPDLGLAVGDLYAWNTVLKYLKMLNLFAPGEGKAGGWNLVNPTTGEIEPYKTQDALKERLRTDLPYADTLYAGLIRTVMASGDVIDAD